MIDKIGLTIIKFNLQLWFFSSTIEKSWKSEVA